MTSYLRPILFYLIFPKRKVLLLRLPHPFPLYFLSVEKQNLLFSPPVMIGKFDADFWEPRKLPKSPPRDFV